MALYCIGDLQGCYTPLRRLLDKIDFSPSRDTLYLLGDLVNRGTESLEVLRALGALGDAAQCLLGNHDIHLLAVAQGFRQAGRHDTLRPILEAPDCGELLDWLRHRPMAIHRHGWLMVHAGVLPQWSVAQTMSLAGELEKALRASGNDERLETLFGNIPDVWHDSLQGIERLRVIVNALTRLRFCSPDGVMDFAHNGSADQAPPGLLPWYEVPGRLTEATPIAFGHWSTLVTASGRTSGMHRNALPLDTGCLWGGRLTAARLNPDQPGEFEAITVKCEQTLKPGSVKS